MTVNKAIEMIDEYLLEPNCIHKDWVECLRLCRKVLEKQSNQKFDNCEGCPYLVGDSCEGFTKYSQPFKDVLDLINRKEKVIKFSTKEIVDLKIKVEQQRAEIERLRKVLENRGEICKSCDEKYTEKIKRAKADAIKEFAERLKKSAFDCDVSFGFGKECYTEAVAVVEIDNVLKEMVGD